MKKITLLLLIVTTWVTAQQNELGQAGFDGLSDAVSSCNGGVNYDATNCNDCPGSRQTAVHGNEEWFRCGSKFDVSNDGSNYYGRFLGGGSTPARQLLEGLNTTKKYKVSLKVSKSEANAVRDIKLIFKPFDNLNGASLDGWEEISADANVTVINSQVTIAPAGIPNGTWSTYEFYFSPPATATVIQIQSKKDNANSSANIHIDDVLVVLVDDTATVSELGAYNFTAYPNPIKDTYTVSATKAIDKIELFSVTGKSVMCKNINAKKATIRTGNLPAGVYIAKVSIGNTIGSYKLIKK